MYKDPDQNILQIQIPVRRGNRSRRLNPIYKKGITELKRDIHRGLNSEDQHSDLYQNDINSDQESIKSGHGKWMKCILENTDGSFQNLFVSIQLSQPCTKVCKRTNASRKNSFVRNKQTIMDRTCDQNKQISRKQSLQNQQFMAQQGVGLCQILLNAAKKVLNEKCCEEQDKKRMICQKQCSQKLVFRGQKQAKQQESGKLMGVSLDQNKILFQHSKLNTVQVNMKPSPLKQHQKNQRPTHLSNGMPLSEIQEIFENHKKSIIRSTIFI